MFRPRTWSTDHEARRPPAVALRAIAGSAVGQLDPLQDEPRNFVHFGARTVEQYQRRLGDQQRDCEEVREEGGAHVRLVTSWAIFGHHQMKGYP
jgi:hypothetical protein